MFGFLKNLKKKPSVDFDAVLESVLRNEISVVACPASANGSPCRSKFGGKPALPAGFEWPRYEAADEEGETAARPLSFLCQINLREVSAYDTENLLPKTGLLLFFYEQESGCWGFDPEDDGCSRVFYFEDVDKLSATALPLDLKEEYVVKEYDLAFSSKPSYPSYEELEYHSDAICDWDDYDEAVENKGYEINNERHKLLGYADPIQSEMLTECERTMRGLYCGNAESYRKTSKEEAREIEEAARDWTLLFQMASIEDEDFELMFGDLGDLYFYIRKQDLKERHFDKAWLILQCG